MNVWGVEIQTSLSRARKIQADAIFLRLDIAIQQCRMARSDFRRQSRALIESAQQTFDDLERYVWRFKLEHEQFDQIAAGMERLKFEIQAARDYPST